MVQPGHWAYSSPWATRVHKRCFSNKRAGGSLGNRGSLGEYILPIFVGGKQGSFGAPPEENFCHPFYILLKTRGVRCYITTRTKRGSFWASREPQNFVPQEKARVYVRPHSVGGANLVTDLGR